MKNYLRYLLNFLMPLLLVSACCMAFAVWRSGAIDAFAKLLLVVASIASLLIAVLVSCTWYMTAIRPCTRRFAVSSEAGRKRALDALNALITEEFRVKRVALRTGECFSGEISFMRGLTETVAIENEPMGIVVHAPKRIMESVEKRMNDMQWQI